MIEYISDALIIVTLAVIAFGALVLVRNEIVFRCRMRAIDHVHSVSPEAVLSWRGSASYEDMLWDFRKWTYHQFYKDLLEEFPE